MPPKPSTEIAEPVEPLLFDEFLRVEMRTGTILSAHLNAQARVPAYILEIDFGALGIKHSSAQITKNHTLESLVGLQIVAVINFEVKRIAGFKSEVLVLGAICDEHDIVLLSPTYKVKNGMLIG